MDIVTKRIYEDPAPEDGTRILVDGLWPRGVSREAATIDRWLKEIAPSAELRRWYGHEPERWDAFRSRYADELTDRDDQLDELRAIARSGRLTLLFAARDEERNNAVALRAILTGRR